MNGLLVSLVTIELILTGVGVLVYVYRNRLEFREENTMILNQAESHLQEGQEGIHARIRQLDRLLWYVGIGWLVFGAASLVAWVVQVAGVV